ncbi:3-oxoacyl-ACP reductase [Platysternon megacephalum]|uniref:glucose-1-phosphate thymidylyltransferase n=1 Tax=Platysternon megacephalum TaxID=55544 RepID=A0A4D9DEJ9_9SAUR|nr:3-oxoacyl-ACP reductase [Platysternon megacephalum]
MRGIVLAGGTGSRLFPLTKAISKQLMPVYDKPMIYYPLTALAQAGIREVLIITTPTDQHQFRQLLGDGAAWGMRLEYAVQPTPGGIAQAFMIGEDFIDGDSVGLALGDNLFYGFSFEEVAIDPTGGEAAHIFAVQVRDPSAYGVVEFDDAGQVHRIREKPEDPQSSFAVPGIYFFDPSVVEIAHRLRPSERGELEITAVNDHYLRRRALTVTCLPRGAAWFDTGTFTGLLDAGQFVHVVEARQGVKIGCIEETVWRQGWIDDAGLQRLAETQMSSGYGQYLAELLSEQTVRGGRR